MTTTRASLLTALIAAGMSLTAPAEAGCLPPTRPARQAQDTPVEINAGRIEFSPENLYHKAKNDPHYYDICIESSISTTGKRPCTVEWEHTIRGDGPAEFSIRKKGAAAPIKEEPYPCGSNCRNVSQKLTRKKPVYIRYSSAVYRIDDLDAEYEVTLKGKVKVNGQWQDYSFQQTVIPRQHLRSAKSR